MTQGATTDAGVEHEERPQADDDHAASVTIPPPAAGIVPPPAAARAPTGDDAVDDVLGQLDAVADEPLDSQIRAGEQVHRVLQDRLADLGKE